ncbi:MAG: proline--tRNA ligase [Chloroflexi bacterium]|nr:proline--tRNA ligase [Chloroflexota bacterium]
MRFTNLFGKTLRQPPADAETVSHKLLARAGMISQVSAGVYAYMPLGYRVLRKIEQIVREEMNAAGGQELFMPSLQPVELWQVSGRLGPFGKTLFALKDRKEHTLVLGPTHEEIITDLFHRHVQSYRELPLLLYQIQNKFRDEPRPRGGLLRVREFVMKDLYSFDADEAGLEISYQKMTAAYQRIFRRCGLPAVQVEADSGAIGGKASHEFMLLADTGEDEIIQCHRCSYNANAEKAQVRKPEMPAEPALPLEAIPTPGVSTIAGLSKLLDVPLGKMLKVVFYVADGAITMVVIRGDLDVNEVKLKNLLKCIDMRMAADDELREAGLVPGFASPVGVKKVKIIADDSIKMGQNFVAGANKHDFHLKNVNFPRDFEVDAIGDIALARAGMECPRCGQQFHSARGVEVGHVFKLGTFLSERLGATFLDESGMSKPAVMGCYGIGVGRLMAAAVEQNHDDKGMVWPAPIAPYHIYLCALSMDRPEVVSAANHVYENLAAAGIEVLYDDRIESPGVKFNDADLLGLPIRVTVSPRTLKTMSVEIKRRSRKDAEIRPIGEAVNTVKDWLPGQTMP